MIETIQKWKSSERLIYLSLKLESAKVVISPGPDPESFFATRGIARARFAFTDFHGDKAEATNRDANKVLAEMERIDTVEAEFAKKIEGPFYFCRDFKEHRKGDQVPPGTNGGQILTMLRNGIIEPKAVEKAPADKMVKQSRNKSEV